LENTFLLIFKKNLGNRTFPIAWNQVGADCYLGTHQSKPGRRSQVLQQKLRSVRAVLLPLSRHHSFALAESFDHLSNGALLEL